MALITLTKDHLMAARSQLGGYSNKQLAFIGLKMPLEKAWRKSVVGKQFPEEAIAEFIALKDAHLTPAKILAAKRREERKEQRIARRKAGVGASLV